MVGERLIFSPLSACKHLGWTPASIFRRGFWFYRVAYTIVPFIIALLSPQHAHSAKPNYKFRGSPASLCDQCCKSSDRLNFYSSGITMDHAGAPYQGHYNCSTYCSISAHGHRGFLLLQVPNIFIVGSC